MYTTVQPFIDLANANMAAFSRLTQSPEIPKLMKSDTDTYLQQTRGFFAHATKSDALVEFTQTMMNNYASFVNALTKGLFSIAGQGQAFVTGQTKEMSSNFQQGLDEVVRAEETRAEPVDTELAAAVPAQTARQKRTPA